jgi:UDP-2,4-diacetamido-2,4,6-trideoxy-beta-L-altropyranose hydrolase
MKVFFRCDSSFLIGSGHIMRCLNLANYLKKIGLESEFVTRPLEGSYYNLLEEKGFKIHLLPEHIANEQEDAMFFKSFLPKEKTIIVVDHYGLTEKWEGLFYNSHPIFCIDDLGRQHQVHALLDTNFRLDYKKPYNKKVPQDCKLFLGPGYSLIRDEFLKEPKSNPSNGKNIMVFFGGGDSKGDTLYFLQKLNSYKTELHWNIVVSANNKFLNEIKNISLVKNISLLIQPSSMAKVMSQSNYYFGSSGTITWERCFMGLVGSVFSIADNQVELAQNLEKGDYQPYLGHFNLDNFKSYMDFIKKEMSDRSVLVSRQRKILELVKPFPLETLKNLFEELQK